MKKWKKRMVALSLALVLTMGMTLTVSARTTGEAHESGEMCIRDSALAANSKRGAIAIGIGFYCATPIISFSPVIVKLFAVEWNPLGKN